MKNLNLINKNMEYEIIIKNKFDLDLKKEWEDLQKDANINFFQTFKWQKYWNEKCGNDIENLITMFYKKGELISILPFNIKKIKFVKILNWNGFPFSDYNQPLIKHNQSLTSKDFNFIISKIYSKYKFDNLHLINCVNCCYLTNKKFISNNISKLIFFENEIDKQIINNFHKKINYDKNRLKKNFKYEVCINENNKKEILNFFIKEKYKQLKRTRAWNYLNFESYKKYIYDLIEFDNQNLCFSCLKINNKIISSHIGYIYNNNYYYIFPVYNQDFKKYSPGNILLSELIENYKVRKFDVFDFTIGNELYKKKLSNFNDHTYEYISSTSFFGLFYYLKSKIKIKIKAILLNRQIK